MALKNYEILTTKEIAGIFLARFSHWFWLITPVIAYLYFSYKFKGLELSYIVFFCLIICISSIFISSSLKLSNTIVKFIIKDKNADRKIAILQSYTYEYFYDSTYLELYLAYKDLGEITYAVESLKKISTNDIEMLLELGFAYLNLGEKDYAIEIFKKVAASKAATASNSEKAISELVKIYYKENNIEETKSWLGKFLWNSSIKNESDRIEISKIEEDLRKKDIELAEKKFQARFPFFSNALNSRYHFEGELKNGLPHGKGKAFFDNRNLYEGDFVDGKMEGEGMFTWNSTDYYVGDFKNDQFDGIGELKYRNGDSYYGQFKQGVREGKGRETIQQFDLIFSNRHISNCPNATRYDGDWKNDVKEGIGKCYDTDNNLIYEGRFIRNHPINYPIPKNITENFDIFLKKNTGDNKLIKNKKAFISYSKQDKAHLQEFKNHLNLQNRQVILDIWDNSMILPGEEWDEKIKTEIYQSNIIFLMLSPEFLSNQTIWENEIAIAIQRHNEGTAIVIPIKTRMCDWSGTPLEKLQGLPKETKFIGKEPKNDEIWTEVVQEILILLRNDKFINEQKSKCG